MAPELFPHETIRDYQDILLETIDGCIEDDKDLVAHAPTGLGKTAASLAATLSNHLNTKKKIVFLTSMHTQHEIALETIKKIRKEHGVKIVGVDVIGKKHLCLQPGVKSLSSSEFAEYCRALREDDACEYYNNLRNGKDRSTKSKAAVNELKNRSPAGQDEFLSTGDKFDVCPYEISLFMGQESDVIVTDYYYLYHPQIRDTFLTKIDSSLDDLILIVDEAHNLPDRVKSLASENLSNYALNAAAKEAVDHGYNDLEDIFIDLLNILEHYEERSHDDETYIERSDFIDKVNEVWEYEALVTTLQDVADDVREEQKSSYVGGLAQFLDAWTKDQPGYARIFKQDHDRQDPFLDLSMSCLDPAQITKTVHDQVENTVLMSGTLNPVEMYRDILGLNPRRTELLNLQSPFPDENRLNMIIPKTTTKYTDRGPSMYDEIATTLKEISEEVPGNIAVFLPSYALVNEIRPRMKNIPKTLFTEEQGLSTTKKKEMIENFKRYKDTGAMLLGVANGNFAEGIDLPGDLLQAVVVVGLPLAKPDLETQSLIDYYDEKYDKGWDYGYLYPAFNTVLQSAGRCIRSEDDKGAIIFLDKRYAWNQYKRCFPPNWDLRVTQLYQRGLKQFFN